MGIKTFERPLITLAENLVYKKAKFIENTYKLDINELNANEKLELISQFINIADNLDNYFQEFINEACENRMWHESTFHGEWDV